MIRLLRCLVRPAVVLAACLAGAPGRAADDDAPPPPGGAEGALGAWALHQRFDQLHERLVHNAYGQALVLDSRQSGDRLLGEVFAQIDQPYPRIAQALQGPDRWCAILVLHLNVKRCRAGPQGLDLALGRKFDQPVEQAFKLHFDYHLGSAGPDYLEAGLSATDGPLGTRDYRIAVEAEPLDGAHTLLHMSYAYAAGLAARLATSAYLVTAGAGKVGFSVEGTDSQGNPRLVGGVRGLIERNTMRYYLAIEAYAASPEPAQLETRLSDWFDATERYHRQLHEMDKPQYLAMKRLEARP